MLDAREIEDVLERTNGHRGNATLRSILADHAPGSTLTRNDLEEAFLAICRAAGLPQPEVNGYLVVRFPWQQVFGDPASVRVTLQGLLRRAA